jgi:serine/threonine protein kinase
MSHPNIIKLFSYSENETEYALLMEYANKATYLQELIFDQHTPVDSEKEIQVYAMDLLEALKHIHGQGVIHCDLKLDNMLAHQEEDDTFPIIKLCDFGLAHKIDPSLGGKALKKTTVGTWGYIAPESHKNKYIGREMDMWSFGLTLYEMAVAYKPTQVKGYEYGKGDLPFRSRDWRGRSKELQDLIIACMEMDPEKRITAEDALQHPYFSTEV